MTTTGGSSSKTLPRTKKNRTAARRRSKAPSNAASISMCRLTAGMVRVSPSGLHPARVAVIQEYAKKWINGTTLHYYFFNRNSDGPDGSWVGSAAKKAVIRRAFCHWKDISMGLDFQEVSNREEAEIRIGFTETEESWSFVGRDAIDVASDPDERTMNFGADLTTEAGWNRALIGTGRTLGFPFTDQDMTSSAAWDNIIATTQRVYPPLKCLVETELKPLESLPLRLAPGEQKDVRIRPQLSRNYRMAIKGQADVVMVLFEDVGGLELFEEMDRELEYVAGDDNSGLGRTARISTRLCRDREYVLRIRMHYSSLRNGTTVLLW